MIFLFIARKWHRKACWGSESIRLARNCKSTPLKGGRVASRNDQQELIRRSWRLPSSMQEHVQKDCYEPGGEFWTGLCELQEASRARSLEKLRFMWELWCRNNDECQRVADSLYPTCLKDGGTFVDCITVVKKIILSWFMKIFWFL